MAEKIFKVTEVNFMVKELLENSFYPFWLSGEIGTLTIHRSNHVYMTLKDSKSELRAVFFRGAEHVRIAKLKVGSKVEMMGNLSIYTVRGDFQFIVKRIRPLGFGDLQRKFEELKRKLQIEGLFDKIHKKSIPVLPKSIGVISSPDGAAVRDFLQVIERRFPNIQIKIYPASVQGRGAEKTIVSGIDFFNRVANVDVIVLTRGGGSMEDLQPFNEELLARTVSSSDIPVISAVGHEIDYTICDMVSDLRVETPSAAAEIVVSSRRELSEKINYLKKQLGQNLTLNLSEIKNRLALCLQSKVLKEPENLVNEKYQQLDDLKNILLKNFLMNFRNKKMKTDFLLESFKSRYLADKFREDSRRFYNLKQNFIKNLKSAFNENKNRLNLAVQKLQSISPAETVRRGYSILLDDKGNIVRNAENITDDNDITALIAEGRLKMKILNSEKGKIEKYMLDFAPK